MKSIRELRTERGWTQLELANEIGVTPSAVYTWESGRNEPRIQQLRDLARVFGVRMDEIEIVEKSTKSELVGVS